MLTAFYSREGISIVHADCRDALSQLPAECIDFVLTDPPYVVSYQGRWDGARREIAGDSDGKWIQPVFSELHRVLKPNSFCVTFYGWPHADLFVGTFKSLGFRIV